MKKWLHIFLFQLIAFTAVGQAVQFIENKGQFDSRVHFKAELSNGAIFAEQDRITFVLHDADKMHEIQDEIHHHENPGQSKSRKELKVNSHAFQIIFKGANKFAYIHGEQAYKHYHNYYIGNNPSKWSSNVKLYKSIIYSDLYNHIDLIIKSIGDELKYEFIVRPSAKIQDIQLLYEGIDRIQLMNAEVIIHTPIGTIKDHGLKSFYTDDTNKAIQSKYKVNDNNLSFELSTYDSSKVVTIDPLLNFATFSGSTIDNWGYTATYDDQGNAYGAGVAFGTGYPITLGAFQSTFAGGTPGPYTQAFPTDISISKFSSDGSQLLYSTFLGGSKQECPHSLIVNSAGELILFGTTSSPDYPTTTGAFDETFNGGTTIIVNNVLEYQGTDIVVSKLSPNGQALNGSTYFGGTANDGFNDEAYTNGLQHNYSDTFRGEVIVGSDGGIYIATTTASSDIPIVNGFQNSFGGGDQDGCLVKFNSNLTQVIWSSYYGGSNSDAVYGLQPNSSGTLYVTGGTRSTDLPGINGNMTTAQGDVDGFVAEINPAGTAIQNASYLGTGNYDQGYFVQLDIDDKVYVYGQTTGNMPISANTYNNPNSGQFIHKYSSDLSTLEISTVVGSGSGTTDIVPSAFLVNNCGQVYISGWGGSTNAAYGGGTTNGMPTSTDAVQNTTDGSDFYLMVLNKDLESLNYATFFGSPTADEHVDGGTSRFDKNGIVYQSVCAACGTATTFPTTPGAFAQTMNSPNCNMAVFKFDVSKLTAVISPNTDTLVCQGDTIAFFNQSNGGTDYEWVFDDGTRSNSENTFKVFDTPGDYEVMLIARDSTQCPGVDTSYMNFTVRAPEFPDAGFTDTTICAGESLTFEFEPGEEYLVFSLGVKGFPFVTSYTETPTQSADYYFIGVNTTCPDTLAISVEISEPPVSENVTLEMCPGDSVAHFLNSQSDYQYNWTPDTAVNIVQDFAVFYPLDTVNYTLDITGKCGTAQKNIAVNVPQINPITTNDTTICAGDTLQITASGGDNFEWSKDGIPRFSQANSFEFIGDTTSQFEVTITSGVCTKNASIAVNVLPARPQPGVHNLDICEGEAATLPFPVQDDFSYQWTPNEAIQIDGDSVHFTPNSNQNYVLEITGDCGTATVNYGISVTTIDDSVTELETSCIGDTIQLEAIGGEQYQWTPPEAFINPNSPNPLYVPSEDITLGVAITADNCTVNRDLSVDVFEKQPQTVDDEYTINFGQSQEIDLLPNYTYDWTPATYLSCSSCANPVATPNEDITYHFTYTDENGCLLKDSVQINVIFDLYIPNAFTPDGDNLNNVFYAYSHVIEEFRMDIFNRWGELLFTSHDIYQGWDGTTNNKPAQGDVYVYKIEYVKVHTTKRLTKTGTVTLVR